MFVGIAVLVTNVAAGACGAVLWLRWSFSNAFWILLRAAQAAVTVQVVLGLILLARSAGSPDGLHLAYGVAPLLITLLSEAMRVGAAQRELQNVQDLDALTSEEQIGVARRVARAEVGVMTVGVLLILTLALRAYQTGG